MDVLNPFLREGILGAIIVLFGAVIIYENRKIEFKDNIINQLQEKRVTDSNQFSERFTQVAKDMVAANKELVFQNSMLQKAVDQLANSMKEILIFVERRRK